MGLDGRSGHLARELRARAGQLVRFRWAVASLGACAYFLVSQSRSVLRGDTDDHLAVDGSTVLVLTLVSLVLLWPVAEDGRPRRRRALTAIGALAFAVLVLGVGSTDTAYAAVPASWMLAAYVARPSWQDPGPGDAPG